MVQTRKGEKFVIVRDIKVSVCSKKVNILRLIRNHERKWDGGGDRDTNTTFHLLFASKVKFSSRVHLLNKIGKKDFERKTELF